MTLLKVQIGDFEFAPSIVGSILTTLLCILFLSLGFWQLDRMQQKKILEQNLRTRLKEEPIQFGEKQGEMISVDFDSFRFQPVKITGEFLNEKNILLDNQIYEGRAGYRVITPLLNENTTTYLLIDRGWIPWGEDRSELPEIPPVHGKVTLLGILNQYPKGLELKKEETPSDLWPYRVQMIDYRQLEAVLSLSIFPYVLQLQKGDSHAFAVSPIYFGLKSDRHLGYAVQWFTIAFATVIYYLVMNLRRL